jgi:hypothetical protein
VDVVVFEVARYDEEGRIQAKDDEDSQNQAN